MAYMIECRSCGARTVAGNITWLLHEKQYHTDKQGNVKCKTCGSTEAHIYRKSQLQEEGEHWERWMEAIIRLTDAPEATYQPYAFLTTGEPGGPVRGIHFGYYKDLSKQGGKLKHGHGPGGAPVLNKAMLLRLLRRLGAYGVVTAGELEGLASELRSRDAV